MTTPEPLAPQSPQPAPSIDPVRPPEPPTPDSTRGFWIGFALGLPIMLVGWRGMVQHAHDVHPGELSHWLIGSAVVHDAVVLPVVVTVGFLGRRVTPPWAWPAVRWALFTTGVLAVVSRPYVAKYGSGGANHTVLPRNYGAGVLVAVAVVWSVAAVWAALIRYRCSGFSKS